MSSMQNNEAQVISRAPVRVNSDAYIRSRKRKHVRERFLMTITHLVLIIGGISMIVPFLWMLSTSLKEPGAVFTFPPQWIPKPVMWENYVRAWKAVPFGRFYLNSIFVAVCVTFGQVFTSSLAAYAFARLHFPGRDKLFLCYLATMMIPGSVTMIPVFILLKTIGWIDTYWGFDSAGYIQCLRHLYAATILHGAAQRSGGCGQDRRL
jgi:ABC-type glycerol-3-phosphate transport system permease component